MKTYTQDELPQGSQAWFLKRLGMFTCSDAQAILAAGKGLETLVFNKVAEKKTGMYTTEYDNPAMQLGRELEESARSAYELETGKQVQKIGFIEYNESVGGSPDGFIGEEGLIEIKCPTNRVFVEYLYYGKIDPKYVAQMQMQMFITDRKFTEYVVYNPNFERALVTQKVKRDEEIIRKLREGLTIGTTRMAEILNKI